MTISHFFSLFLICILTTILMAIIIQLLNRRFKGITDENKKESTTYGIWYVGTIISAGLVFWQTITIVKEAIDFTYQQIQVKQNQADASLIWISVKNYFLFVGVAVIWYILLHFLAIACTKLIVGNKDDREEMVAFNTSYFLIRAGLQISLTIIFLPVYSSLLRVLLPETNILLYN